MPASVRVTADPAAPSVPVRLDVITLPDGEQLRTHTFEADTVVDGSIPLSANPYRLVAMAGGCSIDLMLRPEHETDVVIAVDDAGACRLAAVREHPYQGPIQHDEPNVLIAPNGLPMIDQPLVTVSPQARR